MQTSGLVLDIYDDINGELLRDMYPTRDNIPDMVKTAHALTADEREHLPDDVFALVIQDGDHKLRKFACIDAGHTSLAMNYFLKTAHKLPLPLQKTAAANLCVACSWYDLQPPEELEKIAIVGMAMKGLGTAMKVQQAAGVAHDLNATYQASQDMGPGIHTPAEVQIHKAQMKLGEAVGTPDMPLQAGTDKYETPKAPVKKTASTGHLVHPKTHAPEAELERNHAPTHGKMPDRLPQAKVMKPHVYLKDDPGYEVSAACPAGECKSASYALEGRYPLDSYAQVKAASGYFDDNYKLLSPEDRHEYCVNMVKRADALGISVSPLARKYGSETYAPEEEIKIAMDGRKDIVGTEFHPLLSLLNEKRAELDPLHFCLVLSEFDKTAGINVDYGAHIPDPYYSTFGFEKQAEFSETIGNDTVFGKDLETLGLQGFEDLKQYFGEDMAAEFQKDPVGIYKSMPTPQKKFIIHMARNRTAGNG